MHFLSSLNVDAFAIIEFLKQILYVAFKDLALSGLFSDKPCLTQSFI